MAELLALIPARSGSKRIPGKNIKPLQGKPLIAWTIEAALVSGCFARVIVSTDDLAIAEVARACGAEVPWLRSPENSTDHSGSVDVVLEVLRCIEADGGVIPDAVMLLQPTSPFRRVATIRRAVEMFGASQGESVISVSPAASHPYWCKTISPQGELLPFLPEVDGTLRSQDLPPVYVLNGLLYLAASATLRSCRSFYSEHPRAVLVDGEEEAIDIDTPFDWLVAEAVCAQRREACS